MLTHTCGCCADGFRTQHQDPDHDTGFGMCPSCLRRQVELVDTEWERVESLVADSLNHANRAVFVAMDLPLRRGLILEMIDEGVITWSIRGRE